MATIVHRRDQQPVAGRRLGVGAALAVVVVLLRFGVPAWAPGYEGFRVALLSGLAGTAAIGIWWLTSAPVARPERWVAASMSAALLATTLVLADPSIGLMWCVGFGLPLTSLALVLWTIAGRGLAGGRRWLALIVTLTATTLPWSLVRMDGFQGDHSYAFRWRFAPTAEERLLLREATAALDAGSASFAITDSVWPGFRGPRRDGVVDAVQIATDWQRSPPEVLWRRAIGPGWSSFAVAGDLLITQEQRGDDELIVARGLHTGEPIWHHAERARFVEAMGGPGPRATPAAAAGRVVALGATGVLNVLDAATGTGLWRRDVVVDADVDIPTWGFAGSPLVDGDQVVIAAAGRLLAYDLARGNLRWRGPDGGPSYSSPHALTLGGMPQLLLLDDHGCTSLAARDGRVLWQHPWSGTPLVQPARVPGHDDLLVSAGEGRGVRRIAVRRTADGWHAETRWTSHRLKPNFNDFVLWEGQAYGFDGSRLAALDLATGELLWKGGRYGHGQLLLLAAQRLLLVVAEDGELALVRAVPEGFVELTRIPGLRGKTWNHPIRVADLLVARNGEEVVAFRLPIVRHGDDTGP